jgi:hypothetical protein
MTWTYDPPAGSPLAWPSLKDHVRFLLGDRKQSAWSPSDEDIAASILIWNDTYPDHLDNANGIAASLAVYLADWTSMSGVTTESKTVGNSSLSKTYVADRRSAWLRLASRLAGGSPVPIPGATMSGFGLAAEGSGPPRLFTLGQFDNGPQLPGRTVPSALDLGR